MNRRSLRILLGGFFLSASSLIFAQDYTAYHTGSSTDLITHPAGGICLMGGASEHDEAMKWFLEAANGGDVLVLRASGSDGYNNYMYSTLGVAINSVETIVFNNGNAAYDAYVQQKIQEAEAIWFAGGDQWDYISYWRGTPVDSLINDGLLNRHLVIGGTSAGMAIQGKYYFSAENGTVTSATALSDPHNMNVTVDSNAFIKNGILSDVITDTHYDNPDRKGRHTTFLARILTDYSVVGKGIACDEYTAVCIDSSGIASVFGEHPTYDDNAYFIQPNCDLSDFSPEICSAGNALTWDRSGEVLKVYAVKGTFNGINSFDLNDWKTGSGGSWEHWSVNSGVLTENSAGPINCAVHVEEFEGPFNLEVYPNPSMGELAINSEMEIGSLKIFNSLGGLVYTTRPHAQNVKLDLMELPSGLYHMTIVCGDQTKHQSIQISH